MVATESQGKQGYRFILRPNCSASWTEVRVFLAIVSSVCLGVAGAFACAGYWPVLPFAGAELLLLGYALWWTRARADAVEVVDIDDARVAVEKGRVEAEQRFRFHRHWTRVSLVKPRVRNYPSRLLIGSHGKHVLLGSFLTESERRRLARDIRSALAGVPLTAEPDYEEMNWSEQS